MIYQYLGYRKPSFLDIKNKSLLSLLFLLIVIIFDEFIYFYQNIELFSRINFTIFFEDNNYYFNRQKLYELNKNIKNSKFEPILDSQCFTTTDPLYWKNQKDLEIDKLREEIKKFDKGKFPPHNITFFNKIEKPKVSLIMTIYNQADYIKGAYDQINIQELKDIEIIFVDDASIDNSSLIIKELMKYDKRIVYLKNIINKKQFYSINIGILESKGEYILSIDPDDFILNNILIKAYETAKLYNLDIIQFYMFMGKDLWKEVKYKSGIICKNENVRKIFYNSITRNLPDKLIKRSIYIKSIFFMKIELYHMDYQIHTDDTIFFGIIHFAKSYGFLEQIGYYYNRNPKRKLKMYQKKSRKDTANDNLKSLFNIMKYFIIQSDNNFVEKNNIPYKFFDKKVKGYFYSVINYITEYFDFYLEVLNLFENCKFFDFNKKKEINKIKYEIIKKSHK